MGNITVNERDAGILLTAPEPSLIPVPAIAKAWADTIEAQAVLREARRAVSAAVEEVRRAEEQAELTATDEQIAKGKVPKGLRKAIAAAQDEVAERKLSAKAAGRALLHYAATLKATVDLHRDEWHKAALAEADKALLAIGSGHRTIEVANARLDAALGTLGLLERTDGIVAPVAETAPVLVSEGLGSVVDAIGKAVKSVERHKAAEADRG